MKALEDRILREGKCLLGGALKVDTFLNHQMDLTSNFNGDPMDTWPGWF